MYKHILIPVDSSETASSVMAEAVALLAMCDDCRLTLMHVQTPVYGLSAGMNLAVPVPVSGVQDRLDEEAHDVLDDSSRWLDERGIVHRSVLVRGDPADEICRYAEEETVDLIVVGQRDKGLLEKLLLGSVSTKVVQNAPSHVLVVK
jgi:nucleotide-binding universal stress UspA family protein